MNHCCNNNLKLVDLWKGHKWPWLLLHKLLLHCILCCLIFLDCTKSCCPFSCMFGKKCNSKTFLERLVSQIDVLFWKLCTTYGLYESKPQAKNASNLDAFACYTLISVDKRFIEPCLHVEVNSVIKWWCSVSFLMHLFNLNPTR